MIAFFIGLTTGLFFGIALTCCVVIGDKGEK